MLLRTCLALACAVPAARAESRPNIVVFLSDDHRADVLGCAGHPVLRTPNIDHLAEQGVRYANAFVTTSICAASRATILSGLVERAHRFTFGTPPLARRICEESYPYLARVSGYRTGFVGKFGISVEGGDATIKEMFDSFVPLGRNPYVKTLPDGTRRHVTDLCGDEAIEFIRTNPKGKPFCLSISFNAAHAEDGDREDHYPFPATEAALYAGIEMPRPHLDDDRIYESQPDFLKNSLNRARFFWRWDSPEKYDRNMRNYLRMISGLDRNVGRVLAELAARRLADSTVVIFTGDNGYYMGERGFAGKWSHYDESLRVPLVIHDPRAPRGARGRVPREIVLNVDIAATVRDAAGIRPSAHAGGRSLLPDVWGVSPENGRSGFYCEHRMEHAAIPRWQGYRDARFKYAKYLDVPSASEWLHDLEADPDELTNLATSEAHADVLGLLRDECARRAAMHDRTAVRVLEPLPRVLLLGDSISMGYHRHVKAALAGVASVQRPAENCAGTTKGIAKIDEWLAIDGGDFDVIHFNFGLHDLKRVRPTGGNSNDPDDPRQADVDAYEANLREIVEALLATGAELVFATTTPVPAGVQPHRDRTDPTRYNDVARRVLAGRGVAIADLYSFALTLPAGAQRAADVHFTAEGSRLLAAEVVRHLEAALARSRPQ